MLVDSVLAIRKMVEGEEARVTAKGASWLDCVTPDTPAIQLLLALANMETRELPQAERKATSYPATVSPKGCRQFSFERFR